MPPTKILLLPQESQSKEAEGVHKGSQPLISLIGNAVPELQSLVLDLGRINSELFSYETRSLLQLAERWGDLWCIKERHSSETKIDFFTFEAVHWKSRQQDTVIDFITRYLLPTVFPEIAAE